MIRRKSFQILDKIVLGRSVFKPPYQFNSPLDNEARFVHVINGNSRIIFPTGQITLTSGESLIMKCGNFVNKWLENEDDSHNEIIVFQLFPDVLQQVYDHELPNEIKSLGEGLIQPIVKINANDILLSFINGLRLYIETPNFLSEEILKIKVRELLYILATSESGKVKAILQQLFHSSSYKFQEVIQSNLYENLKLEEFAFLTGLSTSSFQRKFKSIFGTSLKQYILGKRLERAKELLQKSEMRISEIAFESGFDDPGHFSKAFSAKYGTSPSKFRLAN